MATYTIPGDQLGITGNFNIEVPDVVDGIPLYDAGSGESNFPRNTQEQQMLNMIQKQFQTQENIVNQNTNPEAGIVIRDEKAEAALEAWDEDRDRLRIKDPLRHDLNVAEFWAERSPFGKATALDQLGNMLPGGDEFRPDILGQSIKDMLVRRAPDDPKRAMGDMAVIASDIFLTALSIGNTKIRPGGKFNMPLFTNEVRRQGLKGMMEAHPAKTTVGVNIMARMGSDAVYDIMNNVYAYLEDIPLDKTSDPTVENILNVRNEFLWSGGAVGVAKLFPYIKPFIGRTLLGTGGDKKVHTLMIGGKEIEMTSAELASLARKNNIPMSTFNITQNWVGALPPIIGLFPIVGTGARRAKSAQLVAAYKELQKGPEGLFGKEDIARIAKQAKVDKDVKLASAYEDMLRAIEDGSPYALLQDAGLMIDAGFRKTVSDFGTMKGTLFKNAMNYAKSLKGEEFIPTNRLKLLAAEQREILKARNINIETKEFTDDAYGTLKSLDDVFKDVAGKEDLILKTLAQLDGIKQTHVNGEQMVAIIQKLNSVKRNLENLKIDPGSDAAIALNDFHVAAIRMLNDNKEWKKLKPEQQALAQQFSTAYAVANDFFFKNADTLKGRSSMLLKQTDPNISLAGAPPTPGYYFADQMAKIFFNDETIMSPMALKEMKKAIGDDAFFAASRVFFDDIIEQNTRFVNAQIKMPAAAVSIWARGKALITGKEVGEKMITKNFNIPVMDLDAIAKGFGLNDINRRKGIEFVFESKGRNGKEMLEKLDTVMELAKRVDAPDYGDVSSFVKRRGFLGGLGSIVSLGTGGWLAADPISAGATMLMGRWGMSALSDPKFLDSMVVAMDPTLSAVARKAALVTLGRSVFDPERAVEQGYDINSIDDILELIILGDMDESPGFNTKAQDAEKKASQAGPHGDVVRERMMSQKDPFLDPLPEGYMDQSVGQEEILQQMSHMQSPKGTAKQMNPNQRLALAGGNLDQAIALGRPDMSKSSIKPAGKSKGLGSLQGMA